jgi:hypothetical protein
VRRLSDEEGRQLQRIVRRGGGKTDKSIVKWRRSMVVLASAGANSVDAIARLVQTSSDRVREMVHRFNELGMAHKGDKIRAWCAKNAVELCFTPTSRGATRTRSTLTSLPPSEGKGHEPAPSVSAVGGVQRLGPPEPPRSSVLGPQASLLRTRWLHAPRSPKKCRLGLALVVVG